MTMKLYFPSFSIIKNYLPLFTLLRTMTATSNATSKISDLSRIQPEFDNPMELFNNWYDEAKKYVTQGLPHVCCLATVSKDYTVSARNVLMLDNDGSGFIFVTDSRSKKVEQIKEIPKAAMCFVWQFNDEQNQVISKQVRIEGMVEELEKIKVTEIYNNLPIFAKIRSHLCHQNLPGDWEILKQRHDNILEQVEKGDNNLPMLDHFVGYKLLPNMLEFYYAKASTIADRLQYKKNSSDDTWTRLRLNA